MCATSSLPWPLGQPELMVPWEGEGGKLLRIPEICKKKEVQLLWSTLKTAYHEEDKMQQWESKLIE